MQAGFGRTGKMFGFQHYGVRPDLIACGKGISSSLPISAVIGREDIMDLYAPGSMTSTHSGSPLPVVAAVANLEIILKREPGRPRRAHGRNHDAGAAAASSKKYPRAARDAFRAKGWWREFR